MLLSSKSSGDGSSATIAKLLVRNNAKSHCWQWPIALEREIEAIEAPAERDFQAGSSELSSKTLVTAWNTSFSRFILPAK